MKKVLFTLALTLLFLGAGCEMNSGKEQSSIGGATICNPTQGCTGIGSATAGDVGKVLTVSDNSPFTYSLTTVSSSGSSGSSTPGGSDTQVQFNDNGAFAGDSGLTFNSSTNQLAVTNVTATSITSTNLYVSGTTTLGSNLIMGHSNFLTVHGIKGDASDGLYITASNGTAVADFGVGNTANSIFNGGVNIDGQTRLATSLTGLAYLTSGVVSATNTINIATGTISGGFFQTDFTDCDLDTQTVSYDVTTGKFGCLTDATGAGGGGSTTTLTNTQVAFGDADNLVTSSPSLTYNTSTNRLTLTGTVSSTNALFLNTTSTNLFASGLTYTTANGTSITSTNGNITTFTFGTAVGTSVTTTNLAVTGALSLPANSIIDAMVAGSLTITGGSVDNTPIGDSTPSTGAFTGLTFINATGTAQLLIATTTITGGFVQTDFGDCDADAQAVSYDLTTGKFGCGDDDSGGAATVSLTNTLLAFGDADNAMTSSTALYFVTSTSRLVINTANGTVSTTNGLFFNATSTNFFGTNGNFTRATSTSFNATGLTFTNLSGTNATTTNFRASGVTSLAGLTFTNATGTGQFRIATTTITGGLFQTGMSTCNADNETLGYNATTGKFECGDDDTTVSVVSTTNANTRGFTDISPATMVDNNTTEIFNDTTRPNIQPQSVNNSVLVTLDFQLRGGGTSDADAAVRVVRENDPGSTTPTCDLTSDAQVGSSIVGGSLATAFFTNTTDIQTARLSVVDSPATTSPVYYTICSSASSTLTSVPVSLALHVSLTEIQGSGGGTSREYTHIVTSTGSSVWTKPATSTGFIGVRVWTVGGGGGGGGSGTAGNIGAGGGGAGSGYKTIMAASLSATTSVTVGAEGTAGAVGNNDGVAGGTSSFGSHISCTGGGGGNDGGSGGGGGAAGTCTGADLSGSGIAGQSSGAYTDSYRGYGGSAGVDQGFPLSEPSDALSRIIPAGGLLGMYAGAGATRPPSWDANSRTGGSGAYFGAGGSGGQEVGAGGDVAGGAGKQGVVVIQELYQ